MKNIFFEIIKVLFTGVVMLCFFLVIIQNKEIRSVIEQEFFQENKNIEADSLLSEKGNPTESITYSNSVKAKPEKIENKDVIQKIEKRVIKKVTKPTHSFTTARIQLISCRMIYNNHVGNEWNYYGVVDKQNLFLYETIEFSIKEKSKMKIKSVLGEANEKYNDWNDETYTLDLSTVFENIMQISQNVKLRERNGRYAGNTAMFEFTYKIQFN